MADYGSAGEVLGNTVERLPLDTAFWQQRLRAVVEQKPSLDAAQSVIRRMSWSDAADRIVEIAARVAAEPVEMPA